MIMDYLERYRLILKHEIIDEDGWAHNLEEPVVVQQIVTVEGKKYVGVPILINKMMEKMKDLLLQHISK